MMPETNELLEANAATTQHIRRVQSLLDDVVANLLDRARSHDASKLCEPEASTFAKYTSKLKGCDYGSDEYKSHLANMKPALDHHYASNRHHPEHWSRGVLDMSLIDLIEMVVDWKAASERHDSGDIQKSLVINQGRFGYGDELDSILRRTVLEMWPVCREPRHCFGCGSGHKRGDFCSMCGAGKHDYGQAY